MQEPHWAEVIPQWAHGDSWSPFVIYQTLQDALLHRWLNRNGLFILFQVMSVLSPPTYDAVGAGAPSFQLIPSPFRLL